MLLVGPLYVTCTCTFPDIGLGAAAEYAEARRLYASLPDRGALPKSFYGHIDELGALERQLRFTPAGR